MIEHPIKLYEDSFPLSDFTYDNIAESRICPVIGKEDVVPFPVGLILKGPYFKGGNGSKAFACNVIKLQEK